MLNIITLIAKENGRDYITPEDVAKAVGRQGHDLLAVQKAVLAVIAKQTEFGIEDASLCAFIAINCDARSGGAIDNPMLKTNETGGA